jgi:A/G-specific adenine glycosylase
MYSHFKIRVAVYVCSAGNQEIKPLNNQPVMWIRSDEISQYPFPAVNHKFFPELIKYLNV